MMVKYTLTNFGKTLFPVLKVITKWGIGDAENPKNNQEIPDYSSVVSMLPSSS